MALLDKLKSLLGLGDSSARQERRDTEVTVERDRTAADADNEGAVKGVDTAASGADREAGEVPTESRESDGDADPDAGAAPTEPGVPADTGEPSAEEGAASTGTTGGEEAPETESETGTETEAPEPSEAVGTAGAETREGGAVEPTSEKADESAPETEPADAEEGAAASTGATAGEEARGAETETGAATAETGGEAEGESEPVDTVRGIGPAYAERLEDAGVHTVDDLATADPGDVAEATSVSEKRVERWIDRAKEESEE